MLLIAFGSKCRNGKDTAGEAIRDYYAARREQVVRHGMIARTPAVQIVKFADALYKEVRELHGMTDKNPKLLQDVGHARRQENPNYWIDKAFAGIASWAQIVLITDLRYQNEAAAVKARGGHNVLVQRVNADGSPFISDDRPADHPSETDLDGYNFDHYIRTKNPVLTGEFAVTLAGYLFALEGK